MLKVVRGDDFEQSNPRTHNNFKRIEFRPVTHFAYLMRFFYCVIMKYLSSRYEHKVYLPLEVIADAMAGEWLDSLCYYVWMKKVYHKPVFYNYSLRKISAGVKCSPTTIKHHISVLIKHGLAHISAGDLILKSTNSFYKEKNSLIVPVKFSANKSEQRDFLRFTVIKRNFHSQSRKYEYKTDALKYHMAGPESPAELKTYQRLMKDFPDFKKLEKSMRDVFTLSNETFGKFCNRSKSTGIRLQKSFNKLSLITSRRHVELISQSSYSRKAFFQLGLGSNCFLSPKGQIYKRLSNSIARGEVI